MIDHRYHRCTIAAIPCSIILAVVISACVSQSTLSSLVTILGNSTASIAAIEGNTTLATQIKADTTVAAAAVLAWKSGSDATMAIEAMNIVVDDLNLIPIVGPLASLYMPLVDLAIGTAESILALLPQPVLAAAAEDGFPRIKHIGGVARRTVTIKGKTPKNADEFRKSWNKIVAGNPALAAAKI